jgi:hypothetical protein
MDEETREFLKRAYLWVTYDNAVHQELAEEICDITGVLLEWWNGLTDSDRANLLDRVIDDGWQPTWRRQA